MRVYFNFYYLRAEFDLTSTVMKSKRYNNVVAKGCKIYPVVNIALVSSVIDVFFM